MKKIAVLNIMRFGDLIQSIGLLERIKAEYPDCELHLIVNNGFLGALEIIKFVDKIHVLEYTKIANLLGSSHLGSILLYKDLFKFIKQLRDINFDLLINITPSDIAGLISTLINPKRIEGNYIDRNGCRVINNPGTLFYLFLAGNVKTSSFINLVDAFTKAGGFTPSRYRPFIPFQVWEKGKAPLVAVHIGASTPKKCIDPETWGEAASIIHKTTGAEIYLLGVTSEIPLAERFLKVYRGPLKNLVGKISVKELAEVIGNCQVLLCHDTGPMQVAWAVGTKVVSLFLGPVSPFGTGPYGPGHLVLQPSMPCYPCSHQFQCTAFDCKKAVPPEVIAQCAIAILQGKPPKILPSKDFIAFKTTDSIDGMTEPLPIMPLEWSMEYFAKALWRSVLLPYLDKNIDMAHILQNLLVRLDMFFGKDAWRQGIWEAQDQRIYLEELLYLFDLAISISRLMERELQKEAPSFLELHLLTKELEEVERSIELWGNKNNLWELPARALVLWNRAFPMRGGQDPMEVTKSQQWVMSEIRGLIHLLIQVLNEIIKEAENGDTGKIRRAEFGCS